MSAGPVLIVEDNEKNMKLLRDLLRARGYHTFEATSAAQAVELAVEHGPDLVLMDIRLPDADGVETLASMAATRTIAPSLIARTNLSIVASRHGSCPR